MPTPELPGGSQSGCSCVVDLAGLHGEVAALRGELTRLAALVERPWAQPPRAPEPAGAAAPAPVPAVPRPAAPGRVAEPTAAAVPAPAAGVRVDTGRLAAERLALFRSLFAGRDD